MPEPSTSFDSLMSPGMLARSFLNIASGCVLNMLAYVGTIVGLAALWFPELFEPPADPAAESVIPMAMFWPLLAIYSLASFAIGWLTGRVAPFAPSRHVLILAGLLFVTFLQQMVTATPNMKIVGLAFMVVVPAVTLMGGRMASGPNSPVSDDPASS